MKLEAENMKALTSRDIERRLGMRYQTVLRLFSAGTIKAKKERGRWRIDPTDFDRAKRRNQKEISKLKEKYIALYWQGLSHEQLQRCVREDFIRRGIIAESRGFAEQVIYEHIMTRPTI